MMNKLVVMLAILLCSLSVSQWYGMEDSLVPHLHKFHQVCGVKIDAHILIVDELSNKDWAGQCSYYGKYKEIKLKRYYWENYDAAGREQLLFHELGHCVLHRKHINDTNEYGHPNSIMYDTSFGESAIYKIDANYYYKELCNFNKYM